MKFANGDTYEGILEKTNITGTGKYTSEERKFIYEGELVNCLKEGKGKYVSTLDQYTYEGNFKEDKIERTFSIIIELPNKLLFSRPLTEEQQKIETTKAADYSKKKKAKKDPKKKGNEVPQVMTDEEQFENRIYWNFGNDPINFSIEARFQGEPYPNPEKEQKEEEKKEAKKDKGKPKKKDDIPDFLIPDPILITAESNRNLHFKMSILYYKNIAKEVIQVDEESGAEQIIEAEFPLRQSSENTSEMMFTQNGACEIKDLTFEKTETFDEGCYILTITDMTQSQKPLDPIKVAIVISS